MQAAVALVRSRSNSSLATTADDAAVPDATNCVYRQQLATPGGDQPMRGGVIAAHCPTADLRLRKKPVTT